MLLPRPACASDLALPLPCSQLNRIISVLDVDQNGQIEWWEFSVLMAEKWLRQVSKHGPPPKNAGPTARACSADLFVHNTFPAMMSCRMARRNFSSRLNNSNIMTKTVEKQSLI